jgi:hypothetical protein
MSQGIHKDKNNYTNISNNSLYLLRYLEQSSHNIPTRFQSTSIALQVAMKHIYGKNKSK